MPNIQNADTVVFHRSVTFFDSCSAFQEQALKAIENIIAQLKSGNPTFLAEGPGGAVLLGTSFQAGSNGQQQSPICSSLSAPQTFSTPGGYQVWILILFVPIIAFAIKAQLDESLEPCSIELSFN